MGTRERRGREGQARLSTILGAAESVFARKGFYQTRMDDIAGQAELSKGALYYYFKSKDEIYVQLLEREADKVYEEIKGRIRGKDTFLGILETVMDFSVEYFEANNAFLRIFLPCMCDLVRLGDRCTIQRSRRHYDRHARLVKRFLGQAIRRERLPFTLDDLAKFLMMMERGIGLMILEGNTREARETAHFFLNLIKIAMEKNA
jgi:AcrR family transcriptional regulator